MLRKKNSILTALFGLLCAVVLLAVVLMTLEVVYGFSGIESFAKKDNA
jgi:ABC-type transporter Mla subunit MlaD